MSKVEEENFIICPNCDAHGRKGGISCPHCAGMGLGKFSFGRFFYWGPRLGRAVIELDHLRRKFQLSVNLLALLLSVGGLVALGIWLYISTADLTRVEAFGFWRERHPLILLFWLGLIAGMFVYYRLSEEARKKHKIKKLTYDERLKTRTVPNSWPDLKALPRRRKIDVAQGYAPEAIAIVENAYLLADNLQHSEVTPFHLFYATLSDPQVAAIFSRLNTDSKKLITLIKDQINKIEQTNTKTSLSTEVKEILVTAYLDANNLGQNKVTAKNLLIPIAKENEIIREILFELAVDQDKIFNVMLWFIINEKQIEGYKRFRKMAQFKPATNMDRAYTSVATPTLNQLGYDLTVAAKWGKLEYCVAREQEFNSIWQHIESGASGIILVGPPGVGKNTLIDGVAYLMVREDVPRAFQDKRLVELDAARLISGASPAQAQGRLQRVLDEVTRAGNIILYINNIENLIGITSGEEESLDLAEVLASALERKNIYVFGSATGENYVKYIEGKSLGNTMAKVEVNEPQGNQAIQIIESKIGHFEGKYKVYFSYTAIEQVIKLTDKYMHDQYLPEKAIKILELVAVKVAKEKGKESMVSDDDIAVVISEITNIPVTKVGTKESEQLLNLEERIHERMINQEEAVKVVAASLRRARTELRESERPIANFLFLGPTGVGKTELAKTVSQVYFGAEKYMIRVDMSEYQHPDSVKKMIGDAQGATGYLTEAVRQSPFSLILLDEIEKAHGDILNLFLQVMDDGRLTDGQGRTINFTNAILIATSNAGAFYIQEQILKGEDHETIKTVLINEHLNKVMRPELINRFDGVIVFEPLSQEQVVEIARLMLNKVSVMLESKGMSLRVEEEGLRKLAEEGFDPKFGARPLRRLIQDKIEDAIANQILAGNLKRRDIVVIDENAQVQVEKGKVL